MIVHDRIRLNAFPEFFYPNFVTGIASMIRLTFLSLFFILSAFPLFGVIMSTEGAGFLEEKNGHRLLHIRGTPYEMGFQHGKLLKESNARNVGHELRGTN